MTATTRTRPTPGRRLRLAAGGCLAASGAIHAHLYLDGYRVIPFIGPSFLLQAGGSFAVAVLLVLAAPAIFDLAAAGLAAGALAGFALARTVGIAGFIERGLQPAPWALLSVLVECAVLGLLAARLGRLRQARAAATVAG